MMDTVSAAVAAFNDAAATLAGHGEDTSRIRTSDVCIVTWDHIAAYQHAFAVWCHKACLQGFHISFFSHGYHYMLNSMFAGAFRDDTAQEAAAGAIAHDVALAVSKTYATCAAVAAHRVVAVHPTAAAHLAAGAIPTFTTYHLAHANRAAAGVPWLSTCDEEKNYNI